MSAEGKKISVQELYRPVVAEFGKDLPKIIKGGEYHSKEYAFWKEQMHRCRNGWVAPDGVYINPMYYFYINFVPISYEDLKTAEPIVMPPLYFKKDHEYFDEIWFNRSTGISNPATGIIAAKGRRKHWTQNNLSGICMWYFLFERNRDIGLVVPDKETYGLIFDKNFLTPLKSLSIHFFHDAVIEEGKPVFYPNRLAGDGLKELGYQVWENNQKITKNKFFIYVLVENTKVKTKIGDQVRGGKHIFLLCDEVGKVNFSQLKKFHNVAKHTVRVDDFIFGQIVYGGTSDSLHVDATDYIDMFFNPDRFGLKPWFISAADMFLSATDMTTGVTDLEKANKILDAQEAEIKAGGDPEELLQFYQEAPRTPKQSFLIKGSDPTFTEKINEMTSYIVDNKMHTDGFLMRGEFVQTVDKFSGAIRVIFEEKSKGMWCMFRDVKPEPEYRGLDKIVADDVYKDVAPHSTSECCAWVCRAAHPGVEFSDMPIAFFLGRPIRAVFHNQILLAAIYFGMDNQSILFEDNDSACFEFLKVKGYGHLVQWTNGREGIVFKLKEKNEAIALKGKWFETGGYRRLLFLRAWKELMKDDAANSDMRSCFYLWMLDREMARSRPIRYVEGYKPLQPVEKEQTKNTGFNVNNFPHLQRGLNVAR